MLRGQNYSDILIDAKPSDPTYNILHILPQLKDNQVYQQYLKKDLELLQQTILDQYKKKKPDTFIGRNLSSFDHVIAATANNDMFARFCICFNLNGTLPL